MNEREIFLAAHKITQTQERKDFLESACRGDRAMYERIQDFLNSAEAVGSFMESPAPALVAAFDSPNKTQASGDNSAMAASGLEARTLGDFRIFDEIGRGGMGVVYEAEQISLGRRVALKVLSYASILDKAKIERFKIEARAAASLDHPNVVHVHSVGSHRGVHYYAMQFIEGQTLADVIAHERHRRGLDDRASQTPAGPDSSAHAPTEEHSKGESSDEPGAVAVKDTSVAERTSAATVGANEERSRIRRMVKLAIQAAEALEHAHRMGIVHRDIKPSNLLVDGEQHLWVADFGLAMIEAEGNLTATGSLMGTLRYMSPEQVRGDRHVLDHHTDIYSLGATLYEMLTLAPAFPDGDMTQLMQRIPTEEATAPRKLNGGIPRDLETIVLKAMAKDHEDRYATAAAMAEDLRHFLDDEPINAKPPGPIVRAKKWGKRHRSIVATAMGSIGICVLIAGGLLWNERSETLAALARETKEHKFAEDQRREAKRLERVARKQRDIADEQRLMAERQKGAARRNLYEADMHLGSVDWANNNIARFLERLEFHIPQPGHEDLRDWEWYYLFALGHQETHTLFAQRFQLTSISWSPNGKYLAASGEDHTVKIWCEDAGRWQVARVIPNGDSAPGQVDWSPDSSKLAWGSTSGGDRFSNCVRVLNVEEGEITVLRGHTRSVRDVKWSLDGTRLTLAGLDGTVRIWDIRKAECLQVHDLESGHVLRVSLSPKSDKLAAVTRDGGVKVLNARSGERLYQGPPSHKPVSVAWAPTGERLAVGGNDGRLHLLVPDSESVEVTLDAHDGAINSLAWDVKSHQLASGGDDGLVRVWEPTAATCVATLRGHRSAVTSVDWGPDGNSLASASMDHRIKTWDLAKQPPTREIAAHEKGVKKIAWMPNSNMLVSLGVNDGWSLWDSLNGANQGEPVVTEGWGHKDWSPDGRLLALFRRKDERCTTQIIDVTTGVVIQSIQHESTDIRQRLWSPDNEHLAVLRRASVEVWNAREARLVAESPKTVDYIRSLCWSPDGCEIAYCGAGMDSDGGKNAWAGWVYVCDAQTGKLRLKTRHGSSRVQATAISWSPNGKWLASGNFNGLVIVWEAESGYEVARSKLHRSKVTSLQWSPDSRRIASAGVDGRVVITDGLTGKEMITLADGDCTINQISWNQTGQVLAAAGADGVIRIWDASGGYSYANSEEFHEVLMADQANTHGERGVRFIREGRFPEAAVELRQSVTMNPREAYYMHSLGVVLGRLGKHVEAINCYSQAIALAPTNYRYWIDRADAKANLDRLSDAQNDFAHAMELSAEQGFVPPYRDQYSLALLQLGLGDTDNYHKSCQKMVTGCLETEQVDPDALRWTIWTCSLGPGPLATDSKTAELVEAIGALPSTPDVDIHVGGFLLRLGRPEEAMRYLDRATSEDGVVTASPAYAWYLRAIAQQPLQQRGDASRSLGRATELANKELANDESPPGWNRKLTLNILRKKAEKAIR